MLLQKQILREELIYNKVAFSSQIGTNKDINKEKTLASSKGTFWMVVNRYIYKGASVSKKIGTTTSNKKYSINARTKNILVCTTFCTMSMP